MQANAIVGHGEKRRKLDYYPTPPEATQALLDYLQLPKKTKIWECACGTGSMVDVIRSNGYACVGTDIVTGHDFLTHREDCDWIITNPPFFLAEQFIVRAGQIGVPFALLLKSQYWHSQKRLAIFRAYQPTAVLPLTWRPDFTGEGGSLMDMIWCVWNGGDGQTIYCPLERPVMDNTTVDQIRMDILGESVEIK